MVSVLNSTQKKEFDQKGFIIIRNFFDEEETSLLQQASYRDKNIKKHLYDRKDSEGLITKWSLGTIQMIVFMELSQDHIKWLIPWNTC